MFPLCLRGQRRSGRHWVQNLGHWAECDVIISPVFDLQQVADETVSGTALDEVPLSGQEGLGGRSSVILQEVVEQRQLALFLHLVEGYCVHHGLNHPAV